MSSKNSVDCKCKNPVFPTNNAQFSGNTNYSSKTNAMRYSQITRGRGRNYGVNRYIYNDINAFGYYSGGPGGSGAPPRNSF